MRLVFDVLTEVQVTGAITPGRMCAELRDSVLPSHGSAKVHLILTTSAHDEEAITFEGDMDLLRQMGQKIVELIDASRAIMIEAGMMKAKPKP